MAKTNVKTVSKNTTKSGKKQPNAKIVSAKDLLKNLSKPMTQTQQLAYLSEISNFSKKDVGLVIDGLFTIIGAHLKKSGLINLAGLMKIYLVKKQQPKLEKGSTH